MKRLKQAMALLGSVVVIAVIAALMTPRAVRATVATLVQVVNTSANPVSMVAPTSMGVPTANLLTLVCRAPGGDVCSGFYQLNSNGTLASTPYVLPSGDTFVITDIEWSQTGCNPSQPCLFSIGVSNTGTPPPSFLTTTLADANGLAYGAEHLTSGIAVTQEIPSGLGGAPGSSGFIGQVNYQGYLTQ